MNKKDRFPQFIIISSAVIIIATVLVAGYFDSPKYNESVSSDSLEKTVSAGFYIPEFLPENGKIDINNATLEELMTLEQIGEKRAQAIIEYRKNNFGFFSVDDIMLIEEIPHSVYDKIKDKLTLGTYTEVKLDDF